MNNFLIRRHEKTTDFFTTDVTAPQKSVQGLKIWDESWIVEGSCSIVAEVRWSEGVEVSIFVQHGHTNFVPEASSRWPSGVTVLNNHDGTIHNIPHAVDHNRALAGRHPDPHSSTTAYLTQKLLYRWGRSSANTAASRARIRTLRRGMSWWNQYNAHRDLVPTRPTE